VTKSKDMKRTHTLLAFTAIALGMQSAHAQSAGSWLIRGGVTQISPDVTSGNLSAPSLPGTQADVKSATQVSGGITYMVTDHLAVDLPLALPFRHDLGGAGAIAGVGKIGDVKVLPITVFAQYRFLEAQSAFRPYAALGVTYANFFGERGTGTLTGLTNPGGTPTRLKIDDRWGLSSQLGVVGRINEQWFFDVSMAKTFLKTLNTLSTGQTLDIKLDPVTVSLGVGRRF
jgi:outer membrane protein